MSGFDQAFQDQLAAHFFRDDTFCHAAGDLVEPDYFDDPNLQQLVATMQRFWKHYKSCPTAKTFVQLLQSEIVAKRTKIADMTEAKRLLGVIYTHDLKDRQFVLDKIVEFARTQALTNSALDFVDALDSQKPDLIEKALKQIENAKNVGATDTAQAHDFMKGYQDRAAIRRSRLLNTGMNTGITTGCPELDKQLTPHNGWGRKELSILMAPPKGGKTAGLIHFAVAAAQAGNKVFYASCEVSEAIIGDRQDANISGIPMKELQKREAEVEQALEAWHKNRNPKGELIVQAFPIRTLKCSELTRILRKYEGQGTAFDMIVVDYLGIMKPEIAYTDKRFGLAEIGQDLRAIGTIFNAAMLTAYQTNRTGTAKAARTISDGTDAADDYEVVRTADALLTINRTEDDRDQGQFVLYFSEMRNAESGLKMRFGQNLSNMRFITDFIGYD